MIRLLEVQNFLSLAKLSLPLGRRNVLVGPNMAGKSNIIEVFKFLRQMMSPSGGMYGLTAAFHALGGFPEVVWRGGESNVITIRLEGDLLHVDRPDVNWEYAIQIVSNRFHPGPITVQDETLTVREPGRAYPLLRKDPESGRRVIVTSSGGAITQLNENERSALEYELPDWEGNLLKNLFRSFRFYRLIPELMKRANATAAIGALDENGGNLAAWLMTFQTRYREYFDKVLQAAKAVLPDIENVYTIPTVQSQVFIASAEKFLKTDVPAWHMSDGELKFIALVSLIFSPPDLSTPLYLIEELENHIHPRLLETLQQLLNQRQQALGDKAAQIIITTHSPKVVDLTSPDDLIVLEKRNGATVCRRPAANDDIRKLLEEAGLGELYYSGALRGA